MTQTAPNPQIPERLEYVDGDFLFIDWKENGKWYTIRRLRPLSVPEACERLSGMEFPERYLRPIREDRLRETEALDYARTWVETKFPKAFLLVGSVGVGKTQAAVWAAARLLSGRRICRAVFLPAADLKAFMDDASRRPLLRRADLLILDDLGREPGDPVTSHLVEVLVCERYDRDLPVVFTANLSLEDLVRRYGERVADRLREWAWRKVIKNQRSLREAL